MNLKLKIGNDLKRLLGEEVKEEQAGLVDDYFYSLIKPKVFWGSKGVSVQYDKSFEAACVVISQNTSLAPKKLSVKEYFHTLEGLREQAKANTEALKSNNKRSGK